MEDTHCLETLGRLPNVLVADIFELRAELPLGLVDEPGSIGGIGRPAHLELSARDPLVLLVVRGGRRCQDGDRDQQDAGAAERTKPTRAARHRHRFLRFARVPDLLPHRAATAGRFEPSVKRSLARPCGLVQALSCRRIQPKVRPLAGSGSRPGLDIHP